MELRDKMAAMMGPEAEAAYSATGGAGSGDAVRDDTVSALLSLGYQRALAEKAVARVLDQNPDQSIEQVLRASLKFLSR